jgi:hypothetical protein
VLHSYENIFIREEKNKTGTFESENPQLFAGMLRSTRRRKKAIPFDGALSPMLVGHKPMNTHGMVEGPASRRNESVLRQPRESA